MTPTPIESIAQVRPGALNAASVAESIVRLVGEKGAMQVSMDTDGSVYATPADHPFSKAMLRQYGDRVVGTYSVGTSADDILEDLVEQWRGDRGAAA